MPGKGPSASLGGEGLRDHGLLEREGGTAIGAHTVHHPYKGHDNDAREIRGERQADSAHRAQERQYHQRSPAPEAVGTKAHDGRSGCGTAESYRNHHPKLSGRKTRSR